MTQIRIATNQTGQIVFTLAVLLVKMQRNGILVRHNIAIKAL